MDAVMVGVFDVLPYLVAYLAVWGVAAKSGYQSLFSTLCHTCSV